MIIRRATQLCAAVLTTGLAAVGCASAGAGTPQAGRTATKQSSPFAPATSKHSAASGHGRQRPSGHGSQTPSGASRAARPLAGKVIGIDPGHNGLNHTDPAYIDRQIWNGREMENCNTTGTQTASGYTEAQFNWNVAGYLASYLRKDGARIVLTRKNNDGVGPCVNLRSTMLNHTDVAIDIHADGGPTWGRGFTVLEPVADGPNDKVIGSSIRFGGYVHAAFIADTPLRPANYYGHNGYIFRDNLAGLNLTTVPKVLIECGNMPNSADAALLTSPTVQRQIARALEAAIIRFLVGHWTKGTTR
ncbi:MAG TPA: N-acetylmuramoyl-L-alanine amidase [Streptosporangiaceae bacterium]|nr:N-acetylmuramoyl-L-alanine amidase [Streptosporangiaceae bacterium]